MVFGKPRARSSSGIALRVTRNSAASTAAALLIVVLLASCGAMAEKRRGEAFAASISAIDASLGAKDTKGLDAVFRRAAKAARIDSDWLRLLKRAELAQGEGDEGRYPKIADLAVKAHPRSEPVAAASAHAYLRNGLPLKALALFSGALSSEARPALWAEAFMASMSLPGFHATPADYGAFAEAIGDPRPYRAAAALALAAGDRTAAQAWLEKAIAEGSRPPAALLWDCGLYEALAARTDDTADAAEVELMGDAAWMAGDAELAKRRWSRAIAGADRDSLPPGASA